MEQNQQSPGSSSLFQLNLDAQNSYTLRSAASWAKVLGVVGIIMGILCVLAGVLVQQALSNSGGYSYRYRNSGLSANSLGEMGLVIYLVLGLIFILSSIFALNAGNKITRALRANDQMSLSSGFANVRNYFAFWAIMMILMLLLFLVSVASNM